MKWSAYLVKHSVENTIILKRFLRKYVSVDDSYTKGQKPEAGVYAHGNGFVGIIKGVTMNWKLLHPEKKKIMRRNASTTTTKPPSGTVSMKLIKMSSWHKGIAFEIDDVATVKLEIRVFWDVEPCWLENNNSIICGWTK